MPAHIGPVLAFMALLALAGIQKMSNPEPTAGALKAAGLPGERSVVLGLGVFELGVGLTGMVIGGSIPALLGSGLYAGFALFVVNALSRDLPIRSCGCLGATEAPPSMVHVVINAVAVGTLLLAVFAPIDPVSEVLTLGLGARIAFLLFTGGVVYMLYGALTVLPLTMSGARRQDRGLPVRLSGRSS